MPNILSVSCDLGVLVDDAADQVASPGSERIEVSDGLGQWLEWCGLAEEAVPAVLVVVCLVLSQHAYEMPLIPDQRAARQFPPASTVP